MLLDKSYRIVTRTKWAFGMDRLSDLCPALLGLEDISLATFFPVTHTKSRKLAPGEIRITFGEVPVHSSPISVIKSARTILAALIPVVVS